MSNFLGSAIFRASHWVRSSQTPKVLKEIMQEPFVPPEVARFYSHMCPAGVYEAGDGGLRINPPNCVDCKATDVLGPRWTPREGGSGPKYKRM